MSLDVPPAADAHAPPHPAPAGRQGTTERLVTGLIVVAPMVALAFAVVWFWGDGIHVRDVVLAVVMFVVVGHGVTVGFHRLLAHKSFTACRPLALVLVAVGSMGFQGGPIGWVANHRRHHVFADSDQDPHSPHGRGAGVRGRLRGLGHAHVGWLFRPQPTLTSRHAADLVADRTMVAMDALFPFWCAVSLAIPFGLGWIVGGGLQPALTALLWAGGVRVLVVQHVTWSVNSVGHVFGRRPFATTDRSTNVAALAILTMGESWHNGHHAFPRSARHGLLPGQWDSSAVVIRGFEKVGWARDVHLPTAEAIRARALSGGSR